MSSAEKLPDRLRDLSIGEIRELARQIWASYRIPTERQIGEVLAPFFRRSGLTSAATQQHLISSARLRLKQYLVFEAELGGTYYLYADAQVHVVPGMSRKTIENEFLAARAKARRKKPRA